MNIIHKTRIRSYFLCFVGIRSSVPQALVMAIQIHSPHSLRYLLRYWPHEPAQLLVSYDTYPSVSPLKMVKWFPVLAAYGIPHGQPLVSKLEEKLRETLAALDLEREQPRNDLHGIFFPSKQVDKKELVTSFLGQMSKLFHLFLVYKLLIDLLPSFKTLYPLFSRLHVCEHDSSVKARIQ